MWDRQHQVDEAEETLRRAQEREAEKVVGADVRDTTERDKVWERAAGE